MYKLLLTILVTLSLSVQADTHKQCHTTRVIDGDTIDSTCGRIRLTKIDSYESKRNNRAYKQAYYNKVTVEDIVKLGKQATIITTNELADKDFELVVGSPSIDKYGRTLGEIFINGESINEKLLKEHSDIFVPYQ